MRWGEPADATKVEAYNVEWRPVIREDYEGLHGMGGWTSLPGNTTCTTSNPASEYEVRVCEFDKPQLRQVCSRYSRIRMPSGSAPSSNDIKVSIEFPEGGVIKRR